MKVEFTDFPKDSNWVKGLINGGEFEFRAKLFDEDSEFGIDGGRVSKLWVANIWGSCIMNYNGGWDINSKGKYEYDVFQAVLHYLENAPKRFTETG